MSRIPKLTYFPLLGRACTASILDDIPDVAEDDDGGADLEQASLRDLHREYVQVNGDGAAIVSGKNHAGGTLGGISSGSDVYFRVAVKPVSEPVFFSF